jgi:hypothetical protein
MPESKMFVPEHLAPMKTESARKQTTASLPACNAPDLGNNNQVNQMTQK